MKMKLALFFIGAALMASAQTNTPHNWHQFNKEVAGNYVSSGASSLVIKVSGTNYFIAITALNDDDRAYLKTIKKAEKKQQLDDEVQAMQKAGWMEFPAKLIENFPDKVRDQKRGWMDVTFNSYSDAYVAIPEMELGLMVTDANGDTFERCSIFRQLNRPEANVAAIPNPLIDVAMGLKRGDKIRLIGHCYPATKSGKFDENSTFNFASFGVDQIEMIESAADAAAVEKVNNQDGQDFAFPPGVSHK